MHAEGSGFQNVYAPGFHTLYGADLQNLYAVLPQLGKGLIELSLPPSKSILNRLLILAALSQEKVSLEASGWGEDTDCMLAALKALGFEVQVDKPQVNKPLGMIRIHGQGGEIPEASGDLYVDNAGTVARFISALVSLRPGGVYTLDGSAAMRQRPMAHLWQALEAVGALKVEYVEKPGYLPCTLKTYGFRAQSLSVDASLSSQGLSALMMIGALKGLSLSYSGTVPSWPFVEMTARCMQDLGVSVSLQEPSKTICIEPGTYHFPAHYPVGPDATAASYWACLALSTQRPVCIHPYFRDPYQGDWQFLDYLSELGLIRCETITDPLSTLRISPRAYTGATYKGEPISADFKGISDTFLSLLAIGPLLEGPMTLRGLGHTRYQECDRLQAMAYNLKCLGQTVETTEDTITLWPSYAALKRNTPYVIEDYQDHRVVMSFAILGSHPLYREKPWIYLKKPSLCAKTFPSFFKALDFAHSQSEPIYSLYSL